MPEMIRMLIDKPDQGTQKDRIGFTTARRGIDQAALA